MCLDHLDRRHLSVGDHVGEGMRIMGPQRGGLPARHQWLPEVHVDRTITGKPSRAPQESINTRSGNYR